MPTAHKLQQQLSTWDYAMLGYLSNEELAKVLYGDMKVQGITTLFIKPITVGDLPMLRYRLKTLFELDLQR